MLENRKVLSQATSRTKKRTKKKKKNPRKQKGEIDKLRASINAHANRKIIGKKLIKETKPFFPEIKKLHEDKRKQISGIRNEGIYCHC
jgi:hypothetical protein